MAQLPQISSFIGTAGSGAAAATTTTVATAGFGIPDHFLLIYSTHSVITHLLT